jgi:hypothetical protein
MIQQLCRRSHITSKECQIRILRLCGIVAQVQPRISFEKRNKISEQEERGRSRKRTSPSVRRLPAVGESNSKEAIDAPPGLYVLSAGVFRAGSLEFSRQELFHMEKSLPLPAWTTTAPPTNLHVATYVIPCLEAQRSAGGQQVMTD